MNSVHNLTEGMRFIMVMTLPIILLEESSALNSTGGLSESSSTVISTAENNEPEFSTFGADKYFSSKSSDTNTFNYVSEKRSSVGQDQSVQNFMPNTPKFCSDASSWNSHPALLKRPSRNFTQKKYKSGLGMIFYPGFCCKGSCLEKKAMYANVSADRGVLHSIHPSQPGSENVDQILFPIITSGTENLKASRLLKEKIAPQEDLRNSIEVLGSEPTKVEDIALNLERKLSMLTWDTIPTNQNLKPTLLGSSALYDDSASYDSSDLFEIDNISCTRSPRMSSQESYARSKAITRRNSVEGSVADVSPIVSDHVPIIDVSSADMISAYKTIKSKYSCSKGASKSGRSGLFGCKSYKAVKTAENSHRTIDK